MDADLILTPSVAAFLSDESDESVKETASVQICKDLVHGDLDLLKLTLSLQPWLTHSDHEKRSLGCRLLSEVVTSAPGVLIGGKADVMADYLGARLSDWPCVQHAATACLSLVGNPEPHGITQQAGVGLLRRFAATVQVPPLARPERQACLTLWLALVTRCGSTALIPTSHPSVLPSLDLIDTSLTAVEGEKDPRCLLLAFQIIQGVAAAYHSPRVDSKPLEASAEEILDTLSCYWPIKFTPPKNDPHGITRQQLEEGIEAAMASSPFLAPYAIPLILEKLASTHRPAKLDALSALSLCCSAYGKEVLLRKADGSSTSAAVSHSPYSRSLDAIGTLMSRVWSGLRNELLSPCDPEIFSTTGALGAISEELSSRLETAGRASICLSSCTSSLGDGLLDPIMEDALVGMWIKGALRSNDGTGSSPASSARFSCVASVLASVASSSTLGLERVLSDLLPLALHSISAPLSSPPPSAIEENRMASHIRGLQFIGMLAKSLCKCQHERLDGMRGNIEGMIRQCSHELGILGGHLDSIAQPSMHENPAVHKKDPFPPPLKEIVLVYCYAWTNLLSLSLCLHQPHRKEQGKAVSPARDVLHPSSAHPLVTRLAKWALFPPSDDPPLASQQTNPMDPFGSLTPPMGFQGKATTRLQSDLVKSHAASVLSPPGQFALQQAALDALSSLLRSNLGGGGCLTLSDRALNEIMIALTSHGSSDEEDRRLRLQSLAVASLLSGDQGHLGWFLVGSWRDLIVGPLATRPIFEPDTPIITSLDHSSLGFNLQLSTDLIQCLASSILPALLSSPTSKEESDGWKFSNITSLATRLLDSLSFLNISYSNLQVGVREAVDVLLSIAAPCIGQCVALAGRSLNPNALLENLATTTIKRLTDLSPSTQPRDVLLVPLLCSVLTSLPLSVLATGLSEPSLKSSLLNRLVQYALCEEPESHANVNLSASVAIASLILKATDAEIAPLSSLVIESLSTMTDGRLTVNASRALSWTCRALLMRKHEQSLRIIKLTVTILSSPKAKVTDSVKESSALMFRLVMSDDIDLSLSSYGRPLWRQRAFDTCLTRLVQAQSDPSSDPQSLSLALCHLIGACMETQPRLLIGAASTAGPSLSTSLLCLSSLDPISSPSSLPSALQGALAALSHLLGLHMPARDDSKPPWDQAGSHVSSLLTALSRLVSYPGSSRVREEALGVLRGIMASSDEGGTGVFPYQSIHPHRAGVLRAIKGGLDDGRRAVRKAAIDCSKVWSAPL